MNTLVVFYSLTGNNRHLARNLADKLESNLVEIIEKKHRTVLTIMLDTVFKRGTRIETINADLAEYDHIVLVSPIWNSRLATPMQTFLRSANATIPRYSFVSLCGHGTPAQTAVITEQLVILARKAPIVVTELRLVDLMPEEKRDDVYAISNHRVSETDLAWFKDQIDKFIATIEAG